MKRFLAAAALLALTLAGAAFGGHARTAGTVTSTRLVQGGHIRITATVATPAEPGLPLTVTYRVQNVSHVTRTIRLAFSLWYVVHAPDGTTYDTRTLLNGLYLPVVPPTKLRPGESVTRGGFRVRVRWAGPLRITPGWANDALPAVLVDVKPSAAPSRHDALADVLSKTGHLLDHCAPTRPGVAVTGRIDAPDGSAPPLRARCSVTLHAEHGFFQAQVLVVSPPRLVVHLRRTYERLGFLGSGQNATAVAWLFVVTRRGAISVDSTSVASTMNAKSGAPGWQWTTSGVEPRRAGTRCGGTSGGGGGPGGPYVEFVSKCR